MEEPGGTALVEESIAEALDFRRAMRKVDEEWGRRLVVQGLGAGRPVRGRHRGARSVDAEAGRALARLRQPGRRASTCSTRSRPPSSPRADVDGDFCRRLRHPGGHRHQVPAEHGVIVEKCGLYSFFIMFTIGITKGRWNTLVTALQQFKDDYDKNQPLWKVLPEFVPEEPRYERVGLK